MDFLIDKKKMEKTLKIDQWVTLLKELNILFTLGIPFSTKYKVKRLIDEITPIGDTTEKMRIELLDKYAVLDAEQERYIFENDEQKNIFENEYLSLLNNEETIQLKPFRIAEFENITNSSDFRMIFNLIED